MTLVLKRRWTVEKPSKDLYDGGDGLLGKKSKTCYMWVKEGDAKAFHMMKSLMNHIFSTPFLKISEDPGSGVNQKYFDDVLEKIENNKFDNYSNLFDDLEEVLKVTLANEKKGKIRNQRKNYSPEDV